MDERIIYQNENGGVSVVTPSGEVSLDLVILKDLPKGVDYKVINVSDLPPDRYFRSAWEFDVDKISINMSKALEIQKNVLRAQRAPLLLALDVEYMKALETDDKKKMGEIAEEKQMLRDITMRPDLLNAKTPEELKLVTI